MTLQDRMRGCLVGLAVGDALGTAVEFSPRGSFRPVTGMHGGGPFSLAPGQWTDDTSMALCLGRSLVESDGFDADDQMQRYVHWYKDGYLSSTGRCFDIGNATKRALDRFIASGIAMAGDTDPRRAGNGAIMRLAPIPMYYFPNIEATRHYARLSAYTTHAAAECLDAAELLAALLHAIFDGRPDWLYAGARGPRRGIYKLSVSLLASGSYLSKTTNEIAGTGHVVACLEAALWCVAHSSSFQDAVLTAVNLGDDADTTGAVTGQLAGALYGYDAIPAAWRATLHAHDLICDLADDLVEPA